MFYRHNTAAEAAFFIDRLVPKHEIAFRIPIAAVKLAATLRFPLDQVPFTAPGTRNARIFDDSFRIAAFGEVGTGQKLAEAPEFIDHRRAAPFADLSRILAGNGHLFHTAFGVLEFGAKYIVKLMQYVRIRVAALFDAVEGFFHMRRKVDVNNAFKVILQQFDRNDAELGGNKLLVFLFHVIAVLNRIHNGCICAGTADTFFFKRSDQARFRIPRRRLRKVLRLFNSPIMDNRAFGNSRQDLGVIVFFRFLVKLRKSLEENCITCGLEFIDTAFYGNGHVLRFYRRHLAGEKAIPNERIQTQLITCQERCHRLGHQFERCRANGFVRVLAGSL